MGDRNNNVKIDVASPVPVSQNKIREVKKEIGNNYSTSKNQIYRNKGKKENYYDKLSIPDLRKKAAINRIHKWYTMSKIKRNIPTHYYVTMDKKISKTPISKKYFNIPLDKYDIKPKTTYDLVPSSITEYDGGSVSKRDIITEYKFQGVQYDDPDRIIRVMEYNQRFLRPSKILLNEREIPFDIYKFEGLNNLCRNKFVLYYNRKKDSIGIKWVGDHKPVRLPFKPNFNKRNIFYLETIDTESLPLNFKGFDVNILNSNNASMGRFKYTIDDLNNKSDKFCNVVVQGIRD